MALLVSVLMLVMVLPEFAKVYQSFDAPLPGLPKGCWGCRAADRRWPLFGAAARRIAVRLLPLAASAPAVAPT
ncbi:hypothetical protein M8494_23710 [Serratia ureilytica]